MLVEKILQLRVKIAGPHLKMHARHETQKNIHTDVFQKSTFSFSQGISKNLVVCPDEVFSCTWPKMCPQSITNVSW